MRAAMPRPDETRAFPVSVGVLMAAVAGSLDANIFMTRGGVFASAQSGNIVIAGVRLADERWSAALPNLYPVVAFVVAGGLLEAALTAPRLDWFRRRAAEIAIGASVVVVLLLGALPARIPDEVATVAIAAVAVFQLTAFRRMIEWPFATTMTTNDLRLLAAAVVEFARGRERRVGVKMRAYGLVIAGFAAGAVLSAQLTAEFGTRAIWLSLLWLAAAYVLLRRDWTLPG
jgi:uncharacterized membrane protein YoaK (UPF0700 family)